MTAADSLKAFANRVINAARLGRLPEKDTKTLSHLLVRAEKRNLVLSRAILAALSGGEQSEPDVKRFAHMLDLATVRIGEEKEPFSVEEKKELEGIFGRHSLSLGAARKFAIGLDELLAMELKSQMERETVLPKRAEAQAHKTPEKERLAH